ncbi:MAG TPA: hypothetical protein VNE61_14805 [Ktedonobacteraceae bacterium]|nr:hypothetical protein [Ktedonobacteraceae bacterium]
MTGDIMAVPERYLDERQKMVRDQAHRSAFTLVKLLCCLIPLLLLAQYFLPRQPAPSPTRAVASAQNVLSDSVFLTNSLIVQRYQSVHAAQMLRQQPYSLATIKHFVIWVRANPITIVHTIHVPPIAPITPVAPASTAEIALAVGALLLCLYLLFSALPMSVIAWKRRG